MCCAPMEVDGAAAAEDGADAEAGPTDAPGGAPEDGGAQSVQGAKDAGEQGAGAGCKPSAAEVGRTLRQQRTRSPHDERAAGSSGQATNLESRLSAMQADMVESLQGQMAAFFEKYQAQAATVIREEVAEMKQTVDIVQRDLCAVQEVVANTNARVARVERDVDEVRQEQDEMMKMIQALQVESHKSKRALAEQVEAQAEAHRRLEAVQTEAALAIAQAPPPAPLAPGVAENYDRAPDPTKVQIATVALVDRDVVTAFVHSIAREAKVPGDLIDVLQARPLSKSFTVQIKGEPRAAARRAAALLALRRTPAGEWRKFKVQSPDGADVGVYLDPDKSGRQIKAEGFLRRLLKAFRAAAPDGVAFANYGQLSVVRQYIPLAKVDPRGPGEDPVILWNTAGMVATNVSRQEVERVMAEGSVRREAVEWCS